MFEEMISVNWSMNIWKYCTWQSHYNAPYSPPYLYSLFCDLNIFCGCDSWAILWRWCISWHVMTRHTVSWYKSLYYFTVTVFTLIFDFFDYFMIELFLSLHGILFCPKCHLVKISFYMFVLLDHGIKWQWLRRYSRSSSNHRASGSIPSFSYLHVVVSSGKTLCPKFLPMVRPALYMVVCYRVLHGSNFANPHPQSLVLIYLWIQSGHDLTLI